MELAAFCNELRADIEKSYRDCGCNLGWRLLASPVDVLDGAEVAMIDLYPGGNVEPADHPRLAPNAGSAYVSEVWEDAKGPGQASLQKQVRALFEKLDVEPEKVLAGHLIPFRSPDKASEKEGVALGKEIWEKILRRAKPKLVIVMGTKVIKPIRGILRAGQIDPIHVNWGSITVKKAFYPNGRLVVLPHLSRFGVITREQSQSALKEAFGEYWHG